MKKLKVMTVVGTRPEIIRLSRVIACLDLHTEHTLIHTGQNYDYELNKIFFDELGIGEPDKFLDAAGKSIGETIGNIITKTEDVLDSYQPEALLILGDTNSALCSITAKRKKIPIFHMEAGNRCFDERVPEELNRKIVDHVSDINLPYSDIAREYLLREGLLPDRVVKTGSPMFEVLNYYKEKIDSSDVLTKLNLHSEDYFLLSCHREENVDSDVNLEKLGDVLTALAESYGKRIIFSAHPRTRKRLEESNIQLPSLVEVMKPLGFIDYVKLQKSAFAVLSDSGTVTEESSILNIPALNIREAHERPEGMEEGAVMLVGLDKDRIMQALDILKDQSRNESRTFPVVSDYAVPLVSEKVLRIILSYTSYVNQKVWHKRG